MYFIITNKYYNTISQNTVINVCINQYKHIIVDINMNKIFEVKIF